MTATAHFRAFGWPVAILTFGYALYAGNLVRHQARFWDDAFITYRFAKHLAEGQGLVWNPGGERVEGYTSVLHVLVLALGARAGAEPETIALGLSVAAIVAASFVMIRTSRRHGGALTVGSALSIALFLAAEPTAIHSTSGLETPLFVLCLSLSVAAALWLFDTPGLTPALALAAATWLAVLSRPEAVLLGAGLYAVLFAAALGQGHRDDMRLAKLTLVSGLSAAMATAVYAAGKFVYFGYLLPNPYYVKSNRISLAGFSEVRDFLEYVLARLGPVAGMVAVVILAMWKRSAISRRDVIVFAVLLVPAALGLAFYLTIIHEVGGAHRFSFPLLTYLTLAVATGAAVARRALAPGPYGRSASRLTPLAGAASIAWLLTLQPSFDFRPLPRGDFNDYHLRIAEALRTSRLGSSATILTDAAGVIPYVSGFKQLDRVGLTDNYLSGRHPVQQAERERYIWSSNPDVYIGYDPPAGSGANDAASDPMMRTPYVREILMKRRLRTIEDRIFVQDEALLHARMRELRDNWTWLGEIDWPGWHHWRLKCFVYVRNGADPALTTALRGIVQREPQRVVFDHIGG